MKNVESICKTNPKSESPKTPGGISKSLLTPCRRLGLSRNWKRKGPSPFISPLTSQSPNTDNAEAKNAMKNSRKRKLRGTIVAETCDPDNKFEIIESSEHDANINSVPSTSTASEIICTPSRNIHMSRKRSKTLMTVLSKSKVCDDTITDPNIANDLIVESCEKVNNIEKSDTPLKSLNSFIDNTKVVSKPIQLKSTRNNKSFTSPLKTTDKTKIIDNINSFDILDNDVKENLDANEGPKAIIDKNVKVRSPNDLTKECIVVIQKKIFKTSDNRDVSDVSISNYDKNNKDNYSSSATKCNTLVKQNNLPSQVLFDSDSDDIPLSSLNKTKNKMKTIEISSDDDNFTGAINKEVKKLEHKKTSTGDLKNTTKLNIKQATKTNTQLKTSQSSNSFDDEDDDFEFDKKKTIIIRKNYNKVVKPAKARSTGSITQKDIDELRARIQAKKKMLLAKSLTKDTEELRCLIKKWQKGCQDALMELMDLMKVKFPDKHNMDHSELLEMLKIPSKLVGYDSDNDCFTTPDDESILLANFSDL